jgi:hypothetical protein
VSQVSSEAVLTGGLTVMWLAVSAISTWRGRRTGRRSQWRYVALALAAVTLTLLICNLRGYEFVGPGLDVRKGSHS